MFEIDGSKIDWTLLRKHKLTLLISRDKRCNDDLNAEEKESMDGILHLIDYIQDTAVSTGIYTEKEIFGDLGDEVKKYGDDRCIVDIGRKMFVVIYNDKAYELPFKSGDMNLKDDEIEDADYWGSVGVPTDDIKIGDIDPTLKDVNIYYSFEEGQKFNPKDMTCELSDLKWDGEIYSNTGSGGLIPLFFVTKNDNGNRAMKSILQFTIWRSLYNSKYWVTDISGETVEESYNYAELIRWCEQWVMTDSDNLQYGRQISENRYEFMEYDRTDAMIKTASGHGNERTVKDFFVIDPRPEFIKMLIDLDKYSGKQLSDYISAYYSSVAEIVKEYGNKANWIIAECIFEQESGLY